jgi:tetratricopeptide (TPR) repeat protein
VPELLISPQREGKRVDAGFEGDLSILLEFSFVAESSGDSTFEMHRLVQLATRKWSLSRGEMDMHVDRLVVSLDQNMPWVEHANVSACEVLFPHVRSAMELTAYVSSTSKEWRDVMDKAARYASYKGSRILLYQAIEMGERCWEVSKRQLGEEHPDTLVSMSNLALYYYRLGNSRKAAEMEERCWEAKKTQLGEEHPDTLVSMSQLAGYYYQLGDSAKAAEIEERCWEAKKRQLGDEHRDTLVSMSNLAKYYNRLGNSTKATELEERCWEVSERVLGEGHPHTIIYKNNLVRYES